MHNNHQVIKRDEGRYNVKNQLSEEKIAWHLVN